MEVPLQHSGEANKQHSCFREHMGCVKSMWLPSSSMFTWGRLLLCCPFQMVLLLQLHDRHLYARNVIMNAWALWEMWKAGKVSWTVVSAAVLWGMAAPSGASNWHSVQQLLLCCPMLGNERLQFLLLKDERTSINPASFNMVTVPVGNKQNYAKVLENIFWGGVSTRRRLLCDLAQGK